MRGPIIAVAAVAVIAAAAGTAWWLQRAGPSSAPVPSAPMPVPSAQPPSVKVTHPAVARLPEVVRATGELRTAETLLLRTPMPGRIAAILFKEGQRVTRGQALMKLDDAAQKADLQRARASLSEARSNYERSLQLRAKGFLPGDALRESEEAMKAADARKESMEARLAATTLRAPSPALMGQPLANVGDTVAAGQEVVDVELMDPLDLELRVPAAAVPYVRERASLQITVQGLAGRSYAATVLAIDAAGVEERPIVHARVRNRDGQLRSGMHARVRLLTGATRSALAVPDESIVAADGRSYVFKVVEGKASRQEVRLGQRDAGRVEIVNGVAPDDVVIVSPGERLRDGMAVIAVDAPRT